MIVVMKLEPKLGDTTTTINGLEEKSYTFKSNFSVDGVNGATGNSTTI